MIMKRELTKQDVLDMFAKTDKKFDKRLEKSRKKFNEDLAKSRKEGEKRSKEFDESIKKDRKERMLSSKDFDERMKKLSKQIGGIGNNNGDVAEEFFFNGLAAKMRIGEMIFDTIEKKVKAIRKNLEGEYDIILTNSNTVVITEVKYKFHPDDVAPLLDKKIPNFKKLFPMYKDFKIYGAIAGLSVPDGAKKKAIKYGFFVLAQSGDNIKLLNDNVKCY